MNMPKQHTEKLIRMSFRIDETTRARLKAIAKVLASRDNSPVASMTLAIRFAAQIAEIFDGDTISDVVAIAAKLGAHDKSGAPALGEAIKFAVRIAGRAATPPSSKGGK